MGGTGLSSPAAGSLLVTAGASAMTTLAPGSAGSSVVSNGTNWTSEKLITTAWDEGTSGTVAPSGTASSIASVSVGVGSGQNVDLWVSCDVDWGNGTVSGTDQLHVSLALKEDGSVIRTWVLNSAVLSSPSHSRYTISGFFRRTPTATSHTYVLDLVNNNATTGSDTNWSNPSILAYVGST